MTQLISNYQQDVDDKEEEADEKYKSSESLDGLLRSYRLSHELINRLINDETEEILEYFNNKSGSKFDGIFDCLLYATVSAYIALLSLHPDDISRASEVAKECCEFIEKKRKKWSLGTSIAQALNFKSVNYQSFTEEETQAEMCYAGLLVIRGVLCFFRDNILSLFNGAIKLKAAHSSFGICKKLAKHRKFENDELGTVFMESTKFGVGVSNLVLANVPKRLLNILELIGLSGDRDVGLKSLLDGCGNSDTPSVGGLLCFASIVIYYLALKFLLGNGASAEEIQSITELIERYTKRYPDSAAITFMNGRLEVLRGNMDKAFELLKKSVEKDTSRLTVQLFACCELAICHLLRGEYRLSAELMRKIRSQVNLSNSTMIFSEAVFLLAEKDITEEERKTAYQLMRETPDLLVEFCGKHVPFEKFVARKSRQFFAQDQFLLCPEYEYLYQANYFEFTKYIPGRLASIKQQLQDHIDTLQLRKDWQFYADNSALATFLKGICYKHEEDWANAKKCFDLIYDLENDLYYNDHLAMCAHLESGLLEKRAGNLEAALAHFKEAKKKKRLFWIEFRIHVAKAEVKTQLKEMKKNFTL